MNHHRLMVSDPAIRKQLQLAGLRFMYSRAMWLASEVRVIGIQLKNGRITTAQADAKLEEMGAINLVYPELMGAE
ncbi:hypothetical protein [Bradyrhizobium sp. USDA 4454]